MGWSTRCTCSSGMLLGFRKGERNVTVFTASDSASTVEVAPGESFAVELAENPTTGFRWEFAPEPGVELVSSSYAVNDGGGAGGGGTRRFEFRPTEAGEFSLRGRLERA